MTIKKFLRSGLTAAVMFFGCTGAAFAYTPPTLGSPQQNFGIQAVGPGLTDSHLTSAVSTNSTLVSTAQHTLFGFVVNNTTSTAYYLHFYNAAVAPTCSATTGIQFTYKIPVSTTTVVAVNQGMFGESFPLGLGFCLTGAGADGDTTNAATGVILDVLYK